MAEETLQLVPSSTLAGVPVPYVVDFSGQQRQAAGIRHRLGQNAFSGPVAQKIAAATSIVELVDAKVPASHLGAPEKEMLAKAKTDLYSL